MQHWHRQEFTYNILIPKLEKDIYSLTEEEVEAYFRWYMKNVPERVAYVSEVCASELGITVEQLDCSPESLVLLWRWFLQRGKTEGVPQTGANERQGDMSSFASRNQRQLSLETEYILRDIGMYFGETLRKHNPSLYWTYYSIPEDDIFQNHPLIKGFISKNKGRIVELPFEPIHMARIQGLKLLDNSATETDLLKIYTLWTSEYIARE